MMFPKNSPLLASPAGAGVFKLLRGVSFIHAAHEAVADKLGILRRSPLASDNLAADHQLAVSNALEHPERFAILASRDAHRLAVREAIAQDGICRDNVANAAFFLSRIFIIFHVFLLSFFFQLFLSTHREAVQEISNRIARLRVFLHRQRVHVIHSRRITEKR